MAIWDLADELTHPLDFLLIQNGFVKLFHQRAILDGTVSWLRGHRYKVVHVDAAAWQSQADLHQTLPKLWISRITTARTWLLSTIASAT